MGDIVDLNNRRDKPKTIPSSHMFTLDMYMNAAGEFEVYMEVDDNQSEEAIFEAMIAAAMKYAVENNLQEDDTEIEDTPANDR